ncbi:hypothetical protein IIA16_03270 [bacterium]|nr:hypothetical protein [bacterium]
MEENRGCIWIIIAVVAILFFVFRPNNFQSLITNFGGRSDLVLTRVKVLQTVPIDPYDVNGSVAAMSAALAAFAGISEKTAHDIVVAGDLVGEFKGGLVLAEVSASRVPWLYRTDLVAILTVEKIPESLELMLDYPPRLRGVGVGGRYVPADAEEFEGLIGREGVIYIGEASVRIPGIADRTLKDDDTEKMR